ncbi:class I SAM-dependent methyltransferase [Planktothricoides raciborskii]|uniref:Class I SAM-dependent methyltransferase n=1 Tax=Planktothricoides raciborskii FACHB-1370 TaxID=2949576 RepID=A0ABR8EIN0_9CYAN|nr:class I SAM-dependent methyltransferase [Planktothricoides raciborskii]MBD2546162.1 class I SAM-dependent methyltransferase [Planktothricoides raciborskii FACHB-1370]MBD2583840.1 class I SAM-dependent methyltransferase [Planktothricoides raciborskii FACHB-1261]
MNSESNISQAVQQLYDTYPFPPETLLDEPPPGYNWRWNWPVAYSFCTGQKPKNQAIRILDAGCGTGVGTDYLVHLNPEAHITAIDLSSGALEVAQERCQRSGADRVTFHHLSIYDVGQLEGEFDLINCVGVLHHLPDPIRGIKALASKLAQGGLFHIFVYAELGRWEIQLMQKAIGLLQQNSSLDRPTGETYQEGVKIGRQIFAALPENNRILKREKERWAMENHRDASFADMYVHPQEIDYNIDTLFEFIDASGLEFLGFSNVDYWNVERLLGKQPELMERAKQLSDRQRYRLIELLDPEITHYEFFLTRPPLAIADWSNDEALKAAYPEISPCLHGWPSTQVFDYNYQIVDFSPAEFEFLQACETANSSETAKKTIAEILAKVDLDLDGVRSLQKRQIILLSPAQG